MMDIESVTNDDGEPIYYVGDSDLYVVRHPDSEGAIVAVKDTGGGKTPIPLEVAEYDDFAFANISDRENLPAEPDVDHSGLTDSEKKRLRGFYSVQS